MSESNMLEFINAYIACALWSSTDDAGVPLDSAHDITDLSNELYVKFIIECYDFFNENYTLWYREMDCSQAGHDFWLTRNGHGAGFWDRGIAAGELLTTRAQDCGEVDLYIGDDNLIYSL